MTLPSRPAAARHSWRKGRDRAARRASGV